MLKITADYGILPADKWNFDQTGFRIGVGGTCEVITSIHNKGKKLYMADPENRTHLTSIECVNATGVILPPWLIYTGETILQSDIQPTMPGDWNHTHSATGYANEDIMLQWIEWFERYTRKSRQGRYRMLIFDGFSGQTEPKFIRFCELHDIVPYQLPSHSTHLLQPLDVGCFQPLKHFHGQAVSSAVRTGADTFSRADFLYALRDIRKAAFKSSTLISSWKQSGCHPINAQVVIDKLPAYEDSSSEHESDEDSGQHYEVCYDQPPRTHREFQARSQWLRACLSNVPLPHHLRVGLDVYISAAESNSASAHLTQKELDATLAATALRTKRKQMGQKQVAKGKVLSIAQSRQVITERIENEAKPRHLTKKKRAELLPWFIQCARLAAELIERRNIAAARGPVHIRDLPLIGKVRCPAARHTPRNNEWAVVQPQHYNIGRTGGDHYIELQDSPDIRFHRVGDLPLIRDPPRPPPYRTGFELLVDEVDEQIKEGAQRKKKRKAAS
jgi:hypothetical protein